jgi:hypothetical protein
LETNPVRHFDECRGHDEMNLDYLKKLIGDVPTSLMPETMDKYIRELLRSPEIIAVFHKIAGAAPLHAR